MATCIERILRCLLRPGWLVSRLTYRAIQRSLASSPRSDGSGSSLIEGRDLRLDALGIDDGVAPDQCPIILLVLVV